MSTAPAAPGQCPACSAGKTIVTMGKVHKLLDEHGMAKTLDMFTPAEATTVQAAAGYMGSEEGEVGFLYSGWAQSALPHKKIAPDAAWQIRTDHVSLVVEPGRRANPNGDPVFVGVPYGSRARLIFLYLQTEALRNNSREVELGKTLHAWLKRLGISIGGTSMAAVRDQADRIARCRMTFEVKQGNRVGLQNQNILDASMFIEDNDEQGSLFIETAKLSEMFFEQLKKHPVPIEERAVGHISNNSMALDVYCWLAYRLHSLTKPTPITWKALHAQFGQSMPKLDHFRWYFKKPLELAMAVYPEANVVVDAKGLILNPSISPVQPKALSAATKRFKLLAS